MIQTIRKRLKPTDKPFKFHRVGFINGDGEEVSGWLCLIETKEQLDVYLDYMAQKNVYAWFDIKDSPQDKAGHCRTQYAGAWKTILDLQMAKLDRTQLSMVECLQFIEVNSTKTAIDIFYREGSVYVNLQGGCRDTNIRNDSRIKEKIFERCTNRDFSFPTVSKADVKISRWPAGKHFYITVNGETIVVDGVSKWNTVKAAEDAKKEYLKENRFNEDFLPRQIQKEFRIGEYQTGGGRL